MSRRPRSPDNEDDDLSPIPLKLPAKIKFSCSITKNLDLSACVGQECPLTLENLTKDNAIAVECSGGMSKPTVTYYNMFALLLSFNSDVSVFERDELLLPLNRQPIGELDVKILLAKVLANLVTGYASAEDHPDHEIVDQVRALFADHNYDIRAMEESFRIYG